MNPFTPSNLRAILREDFHSFVRKSIETLVGPGAFKPNWHIELICGDLEDVANGLTTRLMLNLPPRHLKSMIASVAFTAWFLGRNPSKNVICISYGQDLASKHARNFQRLVEAHWFKETFTDFEISKNTEGLTETTKGGGRFAASFGGPLTGMGADLMVIDDPMKPEEAATDAGRNKAITIYRETIYSRLEDKASSPIIFVMQRLHEGDLAGWALGMEPWKLRAFPAIATVDEVIDLKGGRPYHRKLGEPLHAAREDLKSLDSIRNMLGPHAFEAQYQQNPTPADGTVLKREWIQRYKTLPDSGEMKIVHSWDTAQKNDARADYSVCTVWGQVRNYHYLLDVFRERLDFPDLLNAVRRLANRDNPSLILIEDKASGIGLVQQLKRLGVSTIPMKAAASKEWRFNTASAAFERKEVLFPEDTPWLIELERELLAFPNSKNDDQVDSVSQYLNHALTKEAELFDYTFVGGPGPLTHDYIADCILMNRPFGLIGRR